MNASRTKTLALPEGLMRFDQMKFNPSQQYQVLSSLGYKKGDTIPVITKNEGGLFPYFLNSKDQKTVMLLRKNDDGSWVVTRGSRRDMEASFGIKGGGSVGAGKASANAEYSQTYTDGQLQDPKTALKADISSGVSDKTRGADGVIKDTPTFGAPSANVGVQANVEAYARRDTVDIGVLHESGAMTTVGIESKHGYASGELGAGFGLDGEKLSKLSEALKSGSIKDLKKIVPLDIDAKGEVCVSKASGMLTFRESPDVTSDGKVSVDEYKIEAGACAGVGREFKFSDGTMRLKAGPLSVSAEKTTDEGDAFPEAQIEHIQSRPGFIQSLAEKLGLKEDKVDDLPQPIPDPRAPKSKTEESREVMMPKKAADETSPETDPDGAEEKFGQFWFDPKDKDGFVNLRDREDVYQRLSLEEAIKKGLVPPGTTREQMTQYRVNDDKFLNILDTSDRTDSRADRIAQTIYPDGKTEPGYAKDSSLDQLGDARGSGVGAVMWGEAGLRGGTAGQSIAEIESDAEDKADVADSHADRAEAALRQARSAARRTAVIVARISAMLAGSRSR